jgi:hypothetical protein
MYRAETNYGEIIKHAYNCISRFGGVLMSFPKSADSYFRVGIPYTIWAPSNMAMYVWGIRYDRIVIHVGKKNGNVIEDISGVGSFEMPLKDLSNDYCFQLWCTYISTIKRDLTTHGWNSFAGLFTEKFDSYYIDVTKQNYLKD